MARPYFNTSLAELEQMFAANVSDAAILKVIEEELGHRSRPGAKRLLTAVQEKISDGKRSAKAAPVKHPPNVSPEQPPQQVGTSAANPVLHATDNKLNGELFGTETEALGKMPDDRERPAVLTRVRPAGTKNLPDAFEFKRSRDLSLNLPDGAPLPDIYVAALSELIREIKKTGSGQKRYELEKGHRTEGAGADSLYSFPFSDEAELFEEAQVELLIGGKRIQATIVSISAGRLLLGLKEDVGQTVSSAVLLIDTTALLVALKEKIEKVKAGELTLNRVLADAVVGKTSWPSEKGFTIPFLDAKQLNPSQRRACERSIVDPIVFIWGPPGCGKTETLSEIIKSTLKANKRVLICSNTNKAVDQVLYKLCKALGRSDEDMEAGRILRLGRIADDKLEAEFSEFVTIDGVVARLAVELEANRRQLEDDIARQDARMEPARQTIALFEAVDAAELRAASAVTDSSHALSEVHAANDESSRASRRKVELQDELASRKNAILTFLRRSEEAIETDLRQVIAQLEELAVRSVALRTRQILVLAEVRAAEAERDDRKRLVVGKDRAAARTFVDKTMEARSALVAELREVVAKLEALRNEAVRRAKVIGATCTKSYLSHGGIGQVDVVVIDEASMVMQPVAWFAAGLARDRVIISGDFRQIPPIVPTSHEAVHEVLALDAFEASGFLGLTDSRLIMLETQYRMAEPICDLIAGPMYNGKLHTAPDRKTIDGQSLPSPFNGHLTIIDTSDLWPFETQTASMSRFNMLHALLARNLAWHFHAEGVITSEKDFGICTPYAAQSRMIEKLLEGESLDGLARVGTVHRYQGDERRIMLLDVPESHGGAWALGQFVQGLPPGHVGARLINVAVSRAQEHLIVMANLTYLDKRLPSMSLLREILHQMQGAGQVVAGAEVLKLRPIEHDLAGLIGQMDLDDVVKSLAIFDEGQFESALSHDIQNAKQSVVIFSGYITPARAAKMADLLRTKVLQGVKVRCVTRPPRSNGSIPEAAGREAIEMLEGIGVVVDCRTRIHQKICLIDNEIVWLGSLNALSHMYHSDETMTRAVNAGFASIVAVHMSKRLQSADRALATVADAENLRCASCDARTVLNEGRHGAYFQCESACGWSQNIKKDQPPSQPTIDMPAVGPPCPTCGKETRLRQGTYGGFYGCTGYPQCKGIAKSGKKKAAPKAKKARKAKR